jgi:hypothetical protein
MMMILAGDLVWYALWHHTSDDHLASCGLEDRLESRGNNKPTSSIVFGTIPFFFANFFTIPWFLQAVVLTTCTWLISFVLATAGRTSFKPCTKVGRQRH